MQCVDNNQNGSILLLVLMFLTVISFLVFAQVEGVVMHIKIIDYQLQNVIAFNRAEASLVNEEQKVYEKFLNNEILPQQEDCYFQYFQVDVEGKFLQTVVRLRSKLSIAKPQDCNTQMQKVFMKRLYWQQIVVGG